MELMERLAALRTERGLTQEELAKEVGVTRQAVSKWERGVISPSTVNLIALGRLYGVSLDELVNGEPPAGGHAAEETPEARPPRRKAVLLKIMGGAAAAAFVLLVSAASVITIVSAIKKVPEFTEDGFPIIDQNDMVVEDIDLSQIEDWTDGVTIIPEDPEDNIIWTDDMVPEDIDLSQVIDLSGETEVFKAADGTTTIFFDATLEP